MSPLPLRTRLFARAERRFARPVEACRDFPGRRSQRLRLQLSFAGRLLFGSADPSVRTTEHVATVDGRRTRMLVHAPATGQDLPVVLNLHGGGWVQGNPEQSMWFASRVAAQVGCVVVSPDYRLAPEEPFPAAVDDAWVLLQWVASTDELERADPSRLVVMGDSAGGNLAAVAALRARDAGGPALVAQVLAYPATEMYERYPSEEEHEHAPVLTSANMRAFAHLYLGDAYGTEAWEASPIRATSHAGLPPTLVVVAGVDPLADNGRRYAATLQDAGVPVRVDEHPGGVHGFLSLPGAVPAAHDAVGGIVQYLRSALTASSS